MCHCHLAQNWLDSLEQWTYGLVSCQQIGWLSELVFLYIYHVYFIGFIADGSWKGQRRNLLKATLLGWRHGKLLFIYRYSYVYPHRQGQWLDSSIGTYSHYRIFERNKKGMELTDCLPSEFCGWSSSPWKLARWARYGCIERKILIWGLARVFFLMQMWLKM